MGVMLFGFCSRFSNFNLTKRISISLVLFKCLQGQLSTVVLVSFNCKLTARFLPVKSLSFSLSPPFFRFGQLCC